VRFGASRPTPSSCCSSCDQRHPRVVLYVTNNCPVWVIIVRNTSQIMMVVRKCRLVGSRSFMKMARFDERSRTCVKLQRFTSTHLYSASVTPHQLLFQLCPKKKQQPIRSSVTLREKSTAPSCNFDCARNLHPQAAISVAREIYSPKLQFRLREKSTAPSCNFGCTRNLQPQAAISVAREAGVLPNPRFRIACHIKPRNWGLKQVREVARGLPGEVCSHVLARR
jgi:hypothetical protein